MNKKRVDPSRNSQSTTYTTWLHMRERCKSPKAVQFKWYGGRGITVCERWDSSFTNFLADMGHRPPGMQIDRIDGNKGYEPGNCRWADKITQMRNQSTTVVVTWQDEKVSLRDLAERLGVPFERAYSRYRRGHTVESALFKTRFRITDEHRKVIFANPSATATQLARDLKISDGSVLRVRRAA